eukprot:8907103-Pyramimonas_sp.AAC.1
MQGAPALLKISLPPKSLRDSGATKCAAIPSHCDPPAQSGVELAGIFGWRCTVGFLVCGSAPAHCASRCPEQPCDAQ